MRSGVVAVDVGVPRTVRRLLGFGALRFTARAAWFDAERRLAESAASGVDAEVVSPFPPLLNYLLPAPSGRDLARWVNEYIASLCRGGAGPDLRARHGAAAGSRPGRR